MSAEFQEKLGRIREFMLQHQYDAVLYGTNENFCWLSCGNYAFVDKGSSAAVAKLLITADAQYVFCNSSEKFRIPEEELKGLPFQLCAYDWHDSEQQAVAGMTGSMRIASDNGIFGMENCNDALAKLRYVLTEAEVKRYREIGPIVAQTVEDCCRAIQIGQNEYEIAGNVTGQLMSMGFQVPVCLIAADDRLLKYRHPLPTANRVKQCAMIAICAQKYGLTISISRIVSFCPPSEELRKKYTAVIAVDAAYILNTVPGVQVGEIVKIGHTVYAKTGYESDFDLHHQGGALGYLTRDYCANEQNSAVVHDRQAFAWNPTIAGVKSEDTFLVDGDKQEMLSFTATWPKKIVSMQGKTIERCDILVKT